MKKCRKYSKISSTATTETISLLWCSTDMFVFKIKNRYVTPMTHGFSASNESVSVY
jgi:hypothetical protein